MKKTIALFVLGLYALSAYAQSDPIRVPMTAERWDSQPGQAEFIEVEGTPAMKVRPPDQNQLFNAHLVARGVTFTDGTIEYDVRVSDWPFSTLYFRRQDEKNGEIFYLRTYRAGNPSGFDAAQYTAMTKGVVLWDLHPAYQAPAVLHKDTWNHVKIVVSGRRAVVYVNDMDHPALDVPSLAGDVAEGGIAFEGAATYANLVVTPGAVEGLPSAEAFDPTLHDPRYLRAWSVTEPSPLPPGQEPVKVSGVQLSGDLNEETAWSEVDAEYGGLVNLSRRFGLSEERRVTWLKATLEAPSAQVRRLDLGFSDEVWVVLNERLIYVDKNLYGHPIGKEPDGRIAVENASFELPLQEGENTLIIGLANSFYGWGIIARLDTNEGLTFAR